MTLPDGFEKPTKPQDLNPAWKKILRVCLFVSVIGACLLSIRPTYQGLKSLRARLLIREAEALANNGEFQSAFNKAMAAYRLRSQMPEAIRMVARLLEGRPEATSFWRQLLNHGSATPADLELIVRSSLTWDRMELAQEAAERLETEVEKALSTLWTLAEYHRRVGDDPRSIHYLEEALIHNPLNQPSRLYLATRLIETQDPERLEDARMHLRTLITNQDQYAAPAIEQWLQTDPPRNEVEEMLQMVPSLPISPEETNLLTLRLRIRLDPEGSVDTIQDELHESMDRSDLERYQLAKLLRQKGAHAQVVQQLPLQTALEHPRLLQVRLDSLADLAKATYRTNRSAGEALWQQVYDELQHTNSPLPKLATEIFSARAAEESGQLRVANLHWRKVLSAGDQTPNAFWTIAAYAEQIGNTNEAIAAYQQIIERGLGASQAYQQIVRLLQSSKQTRLLRSTLRKMLAEFPNDPAFQNDLAYLNLLLNEDMEASLNIAQRLRQQDPNVLAYRITVALGYLRTGEPQKARDLFSGIPATLWSETGPPMQAVHAAILGHTQGADTARSFARQIPIERLLPEERALIEPYL